VRPRPRVELQIPCRPAGRPARRVDGGTAHLPAEKLHARGQVSPLSCWILIHSCTTSLLGRS
jgi:hypothetical protein